MAASRRLTAVGMALAGGLLLAGCGSTTATVHGAATLWAGPVAHCATPPCGIQRRVADVGATVLVQNDRGTVIASTVVGDSGHFTFSVPPGRYMVRLQGIDTATTDVLITATAGHTTGVSLWYPVP